MPLETHFLQDPTRYEMGVDEVGRGPMFGRVYAGAVVLPLINEMTKKFEPNINDKDDDDDKDEEPFNYALMKDSKKFTSAKKLEAAALYIMENAVAWGIGYRDEKAIDEINILQATQASMRDAIGEAMHKFNGKFNGKYNDFTKTKEEKQTPHLLIDGNCFKPMKNPNSPTNLMEFTTVVSGDNTYCCIAAASILAKWHRDQYIAELCETYPELNELYSLGTNKGYGTKAHMDGMREHGITQWHRRTFGSCATSKMNMVKIKDEKMND
jgi:ribonuclease HII